VALVVAAVAILAIGLLGWHLHCWDICDPGSEEWFSREGASEPDVQLALAAVIAGLVGAASVLGWRQRWRYASVLLAASAPVFVVWLVIWIEPG
jgi:hypothetical protein